jgi:hypothetical protein
MLHLGDFVREISTGREGKVDNICSEGILGQEPIPNLWRVLFLDGETPLMQYFKNEGELQLLRCPHEATEAGLVPDRGIMG